MYLRPLWFIFLVAIGPIKGGFAQEEKGGPKNYLRHLITLDIIVSPETKNQANNETMATPEIPKKSFPVEFEYWFQLPSSSSEEPNNVIDEFNPRLLQTVNQAFEEKDTTRAQIKVEDIEYEIAGKSRQVHTGLLVLLPRPPFTNALQCPPLWVFKRRLRRELCNPTTI